MSGLVSVLMTPNILYPSAVIALSLLSYAAKAVGDHYRVAAHATRVSLIADAASRVAGEIAGRLASHPPAGDLLGAVKAAAIAEGVAYLQANLPDTIKAVGVPGDTLASMINGELGKIVAAAPPAPAAVPVAVGA